MMYTVSSQHGITLVVCFLLFHAQLLIKHIHSLHHLHLSFGLQNRFTPHSIRRHNTRGLHPLQHRQFIPSARSESSLLSSDLDIQVAQTC